MIAKKMDLVLLLIFSLLSALCLHGISQQISPQNPDFECVDIYKQPAFQHPLLKNHKIQVKLNPTETGMDYNKRNNQSNVFGELKDLCPQGQVPIQKPNPVNESYHMMSTEFFGQHFAALETGEETTGVYKEASARMSIHAPRVANNQYSRASIWVESGPTDQRNSIHFGWAAHSRIYSDSRPRLTAFWTADGYKQTGCYNTICPGFVQVDKQIYVGMQMLPRTSNGGPEFVSEFSIVQDPSFGNWMLKCDGTLVGYWPNEVFTHLKNGATFIRYGGNVFESPDGISPAMGNGAFPADAASGYETSAFFTQCKYSTEQADNVAISSSVVKVVNDLPSCFNIRYFQNQIPNLGQMFAYGGHCGK
ncbi:PREDICTED: uncharacterized protein LOC104806703 [Tarenaya hassleriana]|uniref:uncharacterized protein LOC104806703 n=1 Tax=Tarenaya hassleriana TaxID=28532 RepID=UPI00053C25D9|nr:PREDICTED: uncharacterized protein LOC104806703 [Tarenaya hassleriana]